MTATTETLSREVAAELAAICAAQADLSRRAYTILGDFLGSLTPAAPDAALEHAPSERIAVDPAPLDVLLERAEAASRKLQELPAVAARAAQTVAAITTRAASDPSPAAIEVPPAPPAPPPAPSPRAAPAALPAPAKPEQTPAPVRAPELAALTPRDRILNLWATTTLTTKEIADRLKIDQPKVAGTLTGLRRGSNYQVLTGDKLRRDASAEVACQAPSPAPPPVAPLARANAAHREKVLDHYAETGDYGSAIERKLGLLRVTVKAAIEEGREAGDPRVKAGDAKRQRREQGR